MITWVLSRKYGEKQTTGCLYVFEDDYSYFNCKTLELAWKGNQQNISCYPAGVYSVIKHQRPNGYYAFWVKDVPGRSNILFHSGNFATINPDTEGCTLVGFRYEDLNKDGEVDILESRKALNMLLAIMPETEFKLHVL